MIDISVVIPTYNRLWSLPTAVQSCLGTAAKVEVIVVDNGSTDGTWEWLQGQPGVRSIRMDNWGKDWAVVEALKVAQGEYVRFLDSDDLLDEGANDGQLRLARDEGVDVVVAGYRDCDEALNPLEALPWVDSDDFIAQQLGEGFSSHYSAFLFRRDFIQDIPHRQDFAFIDDRMFMIEVALKKPRLAVYRKPAFVHRRHGRGRLQDSRGIVKTVATWQKLMAYRKAFTMLAAAGELSPRRTQAPLRFVWSAMRDLAKTHLADAAAVYDWIHEHDPAFAAPVRRSLALAYRTFGYRRIEWLVNLRARLLGRP
jgi:glycosyltransferase involved in cell wall biosynthesis